MSRPRIGKHTAVVVGIRLPKELADAFAAECERLGQTRSERCRDLIWNWLRDRRAHTRRRAKSAKALGA